MCTSLAAGKKATKDGSILISRNEDYTINSWNKYLKGMHAPQYAGSNLTTWTLGNGLTVPLPENCFEYCSIADAAGDTEASESIGDHYFFEARGFNENNVMMSATNSMGINAKALKADPTVAVGIEESIIVTLILPQAKSAADAIKRLGGYVENYGAAEAAGILIADHLGAWYMEIGSGHHWIAVRIPDDQYIVIANSMRIHDVDLTDAKNVKCSSGLYDFTLNNGLLENPDEKSFDFAAAFGYQENMADPDDLYYNVDRIWLAQHILTPSKEQNVREEKYPLFLMPDETITINKAAEVLRAGYRGTVLEGTATRPIGVVRTAESHIMTLNEHMPETLQGTIWQTMGTPLSSTYIPFYARIKHVPKSYAMGDNDYDHTGAYWKFRNLFSLADCVGDEAQNKLQEKWHAYETGLIDEYVMLQNLLCNMDHVEQAERMAESYSVHTLMRTEAFADEMLKKLLTEIAVNQKDR